MHLKGTKIQLRDYQLNDLEEYQKWLTGDHLWKKFNGPYYSKMNEIETKDYLNKIEKRIREKAFAEPRKAVVIADIDTNKFIGTISWYWESKETNWLSVGLVVYNDAFWSKGIGYEALGLWGQYLFDEMPELVRLDLRSWSGNIGMMKLAKKLGYQLEATFRKARIVEGKYYDGVGYGVLRSEWDELYPKGFAQHLQGKFG